MLKLILSLTVFVTVSCNLNAQTFNQYYADVVANYNYDTILNNLQEFEDLGIKGLGTTALSNAESWLVDKYTSYGYSNITLDPFTYGGNGTSNNVVVMKQGCMYPNQYVIIDGHYDTKNGPGTNDNGSGTAIILEVARLLKDVQTKYSILFIHFSGEEDGLIGSTAYVNNNVIPQNMDIKIVFNIDEVGGIAGMTNNIIVCERDTGNPPGNNAQSNVMTNELATCVGLYSNLQTEISYAYASDYMPFEENGEIITGFYEKNESPYPHTINDSLSKLDVNYVFEVGKASLGGTMHFAEAYAPTTITESTCGAYTSPSGNYTWNTTGLYTDTISSVLGCDSIINIDLTVQPITNSISETVCSSYTSPSGNYIWTATGVYTDTLQAVNGCDSVLTIDLTVQPITNSITENVCNSYTSPSGNYTWTSTGVYNDTLQAVNGCDSVLTIDLTVETLSNQVLLSNDTIYALQSGGVTYQWVDCNNNMSPISGETGSYLTGLDGSYAVIVTGSSCADTSDCTILMLQGLNELNTFDFEVFPIPFTNELSIDFKNVSGSKEIFLTDVNGKIIRQEETTSSGVYKITDLKLSNGTYFLDVVLDDEKVMIQKVIKF